MKEKLVFIDCETTGLDPTRHEIIEVAACVYDRDPLNWKIKQWKFHPNDVAAAEPEALYINGYKPETWEITHTNRFQALEEVYDFLAGSKLAGHNGFFDKTFLDHALHYRELKVHHHVLDTKSLAWPWYASEAIENTSLNTCVEYFFGSEVEANFHSAVTDVYWTMRLYQQLVGGNDYQR